MSESRAIQLIGCGFGCALAILCAEFVLPVYVAGLTTAQAWFAATLLGVSVAWSAVEFLPPLLGGEDEQVTVPNFSLPFQRDHVKTELQPVVAPVARPVRRSNNEIALYSDKVKAAVITAWQRTMKRHKTKAAIRITDFVEGPLTVSLGAQIPRADKAVIDDAKKQIPVQLQSLLGVAGKTQAKGKGKKQNIPIAVSYAGGSLWIDIPSPRPWTPDGAMLAQRSTQAIPLDKRTHGDRTDITACVAINSMREPVYLDMANNPAVLWVGPTRRGKTSGLTSALYAICKRNGPDRFRFLVATKKVSDWRVWADTPHCVGVYTDASQACDVLTDMADNEILARSADIWGNYPSLLVIADDLKNLIAQDKGIAVPLKEIASAGGECRVYLWASTQGAGSNEDSAGLDNNATFRVVYKPTSDTSGYQAAGLSGLNVTGLSDAKGDVFIIDNGNIERAATGLTSPDLVAGLYEDETEEGEGGYSWSVAGITPPCAKRGYSTESGDSSGESFPRFSPLSSPSDSPPGNVGNRELADAECIAVWCAMKKNGGSFGVNEMQRRLWGDKGGPYSKKLKAILKRAESLQQHNDADIFDQLDDIDTDVLGGDD